MGKNLTIVAICSIIFLGCEKPREFNIDSINLQDYPVLTDSLTIQKLIYENPQISNWEYIYNRFLLNENSHDPYENSKFNFFKKNFDDLFWGRIDTNSSVLLWDSKHNWPFVFLDSMAFQIIDTISVGKNTGYLILKNSKNNIFHSIIKFNSDIVESKSLFLSFYDNEEKLIKTYLVTEKYEKNIESLCTMRKEIYSELYNNRQLLLVHFKTKKYAYDHFREGQYSYFDSLYICSTYDLRKHRLLKTDTIFDSEKEKRKNKKEEKRIPEYLINIMD